LPTEERSVHCVIIVVLAIKPGKSPWSQAAGRPVGYALAALTTLAAPWPALMLFIALDVFFLSPAPTNAKLIHLATPLAPSMFSGLMLPLLLWAWAIVSYALLNQMSQGRRQIKQFDWLPG
jgi:hypothetical protein